MKCFTSFQAFNNQVIPPRSRVMDMPESSTLELGANVNSSKICLRQGSTSGPHFPRTDVPHCWCQRPSSLPPCFWRVSVLTPHQLWGPPTTGALAIGDRTAWGTGQHGFVSVRTGLYAVRPWVRQALGNFSLELDVRRQN